MKRLVAALALLTCVSASARAGAPPEVAREVTRGLAETAALYRWFHAHPELSNEETKTAARLAQELRALGLEVHEGIGGTGVVGVLKNGDGPVVLYRADMDGLPITENTGVSYASKNDGVMHACGHDIHMATAIGTLRAMIGLKDRWSGTILFVGQPAEEIGAGARQMLADRAFKRILRRVGKPRVAFALHDAADLPAGQVALIGGWVNANVDSVDIVVHGQGGHGARPHEAIDPIVIGADIVMTLQTIRSRRVPGDEPAVITVGKFGAGTKHNIIPPQAELLLTVRSYSDETRETLLREIRRVARSVAKAHGAKRAPTITVRDQYTPAAYNDPEWSARLRRVFQDALGEGNVTEHAPSMGGEDFGRFSRQLEIPGVMWKLGATNPRAWRRSKGEGLPGLHSDRYAPEPEPTLKTGVTTATLALLEALKKT